jgi:hypothetical protein
MNETTPATIDVISETIECTWSQPWNAAAAKRRGRESHGSKHQYELHDRGHDVHRNGSAATEVQRENSATMLDAP